MCDPENTPAYTCADYRDEMRLMALKRRITDPNLSTVERTELEQEVRRLEQAMGLD